MPFVEKYNRRIRHDKTSFFHVMTSSDYNNTTNFGDEDDDYTEKTIVKLINMPLLTSDTDKKTRLSRTSTT
jgi:hypothetical protein